ncbi:DUF4236 domain-containing protein [Amycolatopsis sacchari]|uniref:DUF4236 domain-containing protein n=1 Tax=Amycolatopsis sacchari TaxID=115433 RepID=UPI003D718A9B
MSFYLRTSVKLGPVRVNMSRSGLGASVGVPGFRVGAGPRGSYISLGDGLVSYRATVRPSRGSTKRPAPAARPLPDLPSPGDVILSDVSGATTIEMAEVGSSELVMQLNDAARSPLFWPWSLALTLVLTVLSPWVLLAGIPLTVWLFWKDMVRRTVVAFYDVQGPEATRFQRLVDSFGKARTAQRAWHVVASGAVSTTHQHKTNAGASALVKRVPLTMGVGGPRHLSSNIAIPSLTTPRRSIYLLPDRVLVRDGRHYADIAYGSLRSEAALQRFIEDGSVPSDSLVLGHTWQYVNVKGGPDRRFKNNRKLPILQYGRLSLTGSGGYQAIFDFSTPRASSVLGESLTAMSAALVAPPPRRQPASGGPSPSVPSVDLDRLVENGVKPLPRRRLSAQGRVSVVGESHYQEALRRAVGGAAAGTEPERHLPVVATLVPEPENRHDPCAVRVDVVTGAGTATVGYLSRSDARAYQPPLLTMLRQGRIGTCPAKVTGGAAGRSYGIYLHLADPQALLLHNLVDDADLLEPARLVTVIREEDHQETLAPYHRAGSPRTFLAAELVSSTVSRGKYEGAYAVEVRLDGARVGELTAAMSARYQNLIVEAETRGTQPMCEAMLTHGARGYQIDLLLPNVR